MTYSFFAEQPPVAAVPELWPTGEPLYLWAGFAAFIGLLVGTTELLARYRDEPLAVFEKRPAWIYMSINASVSLSVFGLLYATHASHFPTLSCLQGALLSGFGAMAVLRSKFFTIRTTSSEEIPIGPDIVVQKLLDTFDRSIDRIQASDRWNATHDGLKDVSDADTLAALLEFLKTALTSYVSLSPEERKTFDTAMAGLASDTTANIALRAMAAGLAFQELAGTQNFTEAIKKFKEWRKPAPGVVAGAGV